MFGQLGPALRRLAGKGVGPVALAGGALAGAAGGLAHRGARGDGVGLCDGGGLGLGAGALDVALVLAAEEEEGGDCDGQHDGQEDGHDGAARRHGVLAVHADVVAAVVRHAHVALRAHERLGRGLDALVDVVRLAGADLHVALRRARRGRGLAVRGGGGGGLAEVELGGLSQGSGFCKQPKRIG